MSSPQQDYLMTLWVDIIILPKNHSRFLSLVIRCLYLSPLLLVDMTQDYSCEISLSKYQNIFLGKFPAQSFPLFLQKHCFELQIRKHQFSRNIFQDNLINFILECNSNYQLSYIISIMTQVARTQPVQLRQLKWLRENTPQE